jgi:hypothetical protein
MQDVEETVCLKTKSLDEKPGQRGNFLQGAMYRHHMLASQKSRPFDSRFVSHSERSLENHVIYLTQKVFMITGNSQHQDIGT